MYLFSRFFQLLCSYPPSFSLLPNFIFHRTSAVSCTDHFMVANEKLESGFLTLKKCHYQIFENSSSERRECMPDFHRLVNTHCLIFRYLNLCTPKQQARDQLRVTGKVKTFNEATKGQGMQGKALRNLVEVLEEKRKSSKSCRRDVLRFLFLCIHRFH